MHSIAIGASDRGRVRHVNEDAYLIDPEEGLYLVADGMGGLSRGDLASRMAVDTIARFIAQSRREDITWPIQPLAEYDEEENRLLAAATLANWRIFEYARAEGRRGSMGSTLTGVMTAGPHLLIVNVGDARTYRLREGQLEQMTEDHSLVMEEVRRGNLTAEQARADPRKNVVTRALGVEEVVRVDICTHSCRNGDLYLLCSDGLCGVLSDGQIRERLPKTDPPDLDASLQRLVEAANACGGPDNITAVLVRLAADEG